MKKSFLYTRTGDTGSTSLVGGSRTPKNAPRVQAYGDIDELNAHIGLLRSSMTGVPDTATDTDLLLAASRRLFDIGAHLATPLTPDDDLPGVVVDADLHRLEERIDTIDAELPPQRTFILPGGTLAASQAHVARTVCRRAERSILDFIQDAGERVDTGVLRYINRLSDYLFILARRLNHLSGIPDIPWEKQ